MVSWAKEETGPAINATATHPAMQVLYVTLFTLDMDFLLFIGAIG
jgi:hypothetical protein